jgi:hypothetical protein
VRAGGEGSESVRLAWRNGESFDEVAVYRGENLVATLDGASVEWSDDAGAGPEAFYRVAGRSHGFEGPSAVCYPTRRQNSCAATWRRMAS